MEEIIKLLKEKELTISTMESCTGGGLVNSLTNIEGASEVLKFSAVTYSNEFKIKMGVSEEVIEKHSVYSIETANEMAFNIAKFTNSNLGVGITGKLNREDENNPGGSNNRAYISIYDKDNDVFIDEDVLVLYQEREKNKEVIINKVKEMLLELLKNN